MKRTPLSVAGASWLAAATFLVTVLFGVATFGLTPFRLAFGALASAAPLVLQAPATSTAPTFYRDVLPILEAHCQECHRTSGIAPLAFESYSQTKPYAEALRIATSNKTMPPWFANPSVGKFSNDLSLSPEEIATLAAWAASQAPAGDPRDAPTPRVWADRWTIPEPDVVLKMPQPVHLPAQGDIDYTYEIVPTHFTEGRWVQMAEVLPSRRGNVHHAVVYVRPPDSPWLRHAPIGAPFTSESLTDPELRAGAMWTDSDILLVYAPGSSPDMWGHHGEIYSCGQRSRLADALHLKWRCGRGSDQRWLAIFQAAATAACAHPAAYQRPFCNSAGSAQLPRGSAWHASQRGNLAELFSAHAPARKAF